MPGIVRHHKISVQDNRLYYLSVAEATGSMRAAADAIGVAASSISRQIGQLERDLKIELVEQRSGHSMRLTDAGMALVEYYDRRQKHHQDLLQELSRLRRKRTQVVRIAAGDGLLQTPMITSLQTALGNHRDVSFELTSTSSPMVHDMVSEGVVSFGLMLEIASEISVRIRSSIDTPLVAVMPLDHPLTRYKRVPLSEFSEQRLVLPSTETRTSEMIFSIFGEQQIRLNPILTSNSMTPILSAVRSGMAISLLPDIRVYDDLRGGKLCIRPIDSELAGSIQTHLVLRTGHRLSESAEAAVRAVEVGMAKYARERQELLNPPAATAAPLKRA